MKKNYVGIDVGGSKIYGARFSQQWDSIADMQVPTEAHRERDTILANLCQVIDTLLDEKTEAIGIAWAGFVQSSKGCISYSPNIKAMHEFPLQSYLEKKYQRPVIIENDASLMTYAEQQKGAAQGSSSVLGIIMGTGIGGGLIINGELYRGHDGYALEPGHMICSKSGKNELEQTLGINGIKKHLNKVLGKDICNRLQEYCPTLDTATVAMFEPILDELSVFLYNMILLFNPEVIVFGGGVGQNVLPRFETILTEKVSTLFLDKHFPLQCNLRFSTIRNSGALGAALYAAKKQ